MKRKTFTIGELFDGCESDRIKDGVRAMKEFIIDDEAISRFASKIEFNEMGCLIWKAHCNKDGYGQFWIRRVSGKKIAAMAHRVGYEMMHGGVPQNMQLDHLCRNRQCVNPFHLEPVTTIENTRRGKVTKGWCRDTNLCPYGHEYTEESTYINPNGSRQCRLCMRTLENQRRKAKRENKFKEKR
jgi:hypothetical protein